MFLQEDVPTIGHDVIVLLKCTFHLAFLGLVLQM